MEAFLQPINNLTRIDIDRSPSKWLDFYSPEYVDEIWNEMCATNPKYFNAPILVFQRYFPDTGVIKVGIEQYKHHAVYNSDHSAYHLDLGVRLFAVTACIQRKDPNGTQYLIGKRSRNSHCYGGRWEFGPSGGIEPPENRNTLKPIELIQSLANEVLEETGIKIDANYCTPLTLIYDDNIDSEDIHIGIVLQDEQEITTNWEYDDTRWITLDELIEWCDGSPNELIPTTIEHARFLHKTGN